MPIYHATWIFNAGRGGWSEGFYFESSESTPRGAYNTQSAIQVARAAMLAGAGDPADAGFDSGRPKLEGVRISLADSPFTTFGAATGTGTLDAGRLNPTDQSRDNTLVLTMWNAAGTTKRNFPMLGLPNVWLDTIINNRKYRGVPNAKGQKALDNLILRMLPLVGNSILRIRKLVKTAAGANVITKAKKNVTSGKIELTVPGTTLQPNDEVTVNQLAQSLGIKGLNGKTTVYTAGDDVVVLNKTACDPCMVAGTDYFPKKGKIWKVSYTYEAVANIEATGWSDKEIGRAFFVQRARRNKQCCAR